MLAVCHVTGATCWPRRSRFRRRASKSQPLTAASRQPHRTMNQKSYWAAPYTPHRTNWTPVTPRDLTAEHKAQEIARQFGLLPTPHILAALKQALLTDLNAS